MAKRDEYVPQTVYLTRRNIEQIDAMRDRRTGETRGDVVRAAIRRMFAEESTREGGRVVDDRQVEMFGEAAE